MRARLPVLVIALLPVAAAAQTPDDVASWMGDPRVRAALDAARAGEPAAIDEQIRLCEIPAPPFGEAARAEAYARAFRAAGLRNVRLDRAGNVLGERPGRARRPHLVMSAHLDTVFPEGTDVTVRRAGSLLRGPGIGDDCRGLAVLLAVVRALDAAGVRTAGTVTFVGTVGEEGLGDLRGVQALFGETLQGQIDRFVSVDGGGDAVTTVAVGSHRYRVTMRGPGGHSYNDFGRANPIHALGRAAAVIADFTVPADPRTTFSIGRLGGGTSINAIAEEAWMEVDLRSSDQQALDALDARLHQAIDRAVRLENERWSQNGRVRVSVERIGTRPAGRTPVDDPIVGLTRAVFAALGTPAVFDEGSTDANVPMRLGVPAVTVGSGGVSAAAHTERETFDTAGSWRGTQRTVLLTIALAGGPD